MFESIHVDIHVNVLKYNGHNAWGRLMNEPLLDKAQLYAK